MLQGHNQKQTTQEPEEIGANHICDVGLVFRRNGELSYLNSKKKKKKKTPNHKNGPTIKILKKI